MRRKRPNKKNIDFKIFSNIKDKHLRCIKVLGLKIFEEYSNDSFRIQKFVGNLVYTKRFRSSVRERKVFKFLNLTISERIIEDDVMKYNLLGFTYKKIDLQNIFYKQYLKDLKIDYDDVYILHANSGEAYLFFAYCAKAFLNKKKSKKPLFIATQDYHVDIVNMYLPGANVILLENLRLKTKSNKWVVNEHNCYMIFSAIHFDTVEKETCRKEIGQVHYLNSIDATLNVSKQDYTKPIVKIAPQVKQSLKEKISTLNLNVENFVIIAPEAQTCEELPSSLWNDIVNELKQRGYDVFLNIVNKESYINGCKSTFLTYQEVFQLATKAKAVISLRSGFTEFLLPAEIPNITIYTKFRERKKNAFSVEKTISAFSMHKFPFINHDLICELNIDDFKNDNELLTSIMKNLDKRVIREVQAV